MSEQESLQKRLYLAQKRVPVITKVSMTKKRTVVPPLNLQSIPEISEPPSSARVTSNPRTARLPTCRVINTAEMEIPATARNEKSAPPSWSSRITKDFEQWKLHPL